MTISSLTQSFPCGICDRTFETQAGRSTHAFRAHGIKRDHGTTRMYRRGCPCDECRAAASNAKKRQRRGLQAESSDFQCFACDKTFKNQAGLSAHIKGRHEQKVLRGTPACYRRGCAHEECRKAYNENQRDYYHARKPQGIEEPRSLDKCLFDSGAAAGVPNEKIEASLTQYPAETLHWALWRQSGVFRELCRCDVPDEVLNSFEEAS